MELRTVARSYDDCMIVFCFISGSGEHRRCCGYIFVGRLDEYA